MTEEERIEPTESSPTEDRPTDPAPQSKGSPAEPAQAEGTSKRRSQGRSKQDNSASEAQSKGKGKGKQARSKSNEVTAKKSGDAKPAKSDAEPTRELDLIVYGATGFTGELVAQYLADNAPPGVRIGLAGRSEQKLSTVRDRIGERAKSWPLLIADSSDQMSLDTLASSTKAIVSTVGPYAQYGLPLVQACAGAGTNYADLAGEVLFMRDSIDQFDSIARESGARIVHSCGFDSIPSDLGVLALHLAAKADDGQGHLGQTEFVITRMSGSFSGGTVASGIGEMDRIRSEKRARRVVGDPHSLSPQREAEPDSKNDRELHGVDHDDVLDSYVAPFFMAAVNSRVVRRSNALQDWAYGRKFRYRETLATGSGISGRLKAIATAAGSAATGMVMATPTTRGLAMRFLPDPGEGPDQETRENGSFNIEFHATTDPGVSYRGRVAAKGDPGYAATAVMLSQSGLALAGDEALLPATSGVLTPATGLGSHLIDRLKAAGFTITASRS